MRWIIPSEEILPDEDQLVLHFKPATTQANRTEYLIDYLVHISLAGFPPHGPTPSSSHLTMS